MKMRKDFHHKTMVPVTIKNIIHYILYWYVYWQIERRLFQNTHFKKGDIVEYNWKAKVVIPTVFSYKGGKYKEITKITQCKDGSAFCYYLDLDCKEEESCDAFWLRRVR